MVSEQDQARRLSREDCLCPVCMEIYLEPVTLPCLHTFCKPCFLQSVDQASLCCPMCRKRVSTWARLNKRNQTLVNQELWREVQTCFPLQCQRRLSGEEQQEEQAQTSRPRVCEPGELRREYEDQVSRLEEERRVREEEERKTSEMFIQQLLQEEEQRLAQERRRQEEKVEEDQRLARLLSQELNSSPMSASPHNRKKPTTGQIDRFLIPLPPKPTSPDSSQENMLPTPPHPDHLHQTTAAPPGDSDHSRPAAPLHRDHSRPGPSIDLLHIGPASPRDHDQSRASPGLSLSFKRRSFHGDTDSSSSKRRCPSPPAPLPRPAEEEEAEVLLVEELSRQEEVMFRRHQQEEQDRVVALLLQKELDKEEQLASSDRSRGSGNPYTLRRNASRPLDPESQKPRKTSSSCPSSSQKEACSPQTLSASIPGPAPQLPRANRQASLKEMFQRLSS